MSSDSGITRRIGLAALGGLALLALTGCGFQPLYAERPSGQGVADQLASVDIEPINTRVGQELRNKLMFGLAGGKSAPSVYRLTIALTTTASKLAVAETSGRGEASFVQARATYVLKRIDTGEVVLQATQNANASYDQTEQRFANYRAEIDAENRAVGVLADLMRTRISAALARRA